MQYSIILAVIIISLCCAVSGLPLHCFLLPVLTAWKLQLFFLRSPSVGCSRLLQDIGYHPAVRNAQRKTSMSVLPLRNSSLSSVFCCHCFWRSCSFFRTNFDLTILKKLRYMLSFLSASTGSTCCTVYRCTVSVLVHLNKEFIYWLIYLTYCVTSLYL